jgi:hypothetical protein
MTGVSLHAVTFQYFALGVHLCKVVIMDFCVIPCDVRETDASQISKWVTLPLFPRQSLIGGTSSG